MADRLVDPNAVVDVWHFEPGLKVLKYEQYLWDLLSVEFPACRIIEDLIKRR